MRLPSRYSPSWAPPRRWPPAPAAPAPWCWALLPGLPAGSSATCWCAKSRWCSASKSTFTPPPPFAARQYSCSPPPAGPNLPPPPSLVSFLFLFSASPPSAGVSPCHCMSIAPSEFLVFYAAHDSRDGLALLFEAREVPEVGEVAALLRLDRLDRAIDPFQEDAFAIGFLREREPLPILPQTR